MTAKEISTHILEFSHDDYEYNDDLQKLAKAYLALDRKYAASLEVIEAAKRIYLYPVEPQRDEAMVNFRTVLDKFQKETGELK